jgi:hypothetical protein
MEMWCPSVRFETQISQDRRGLGRAVNQADRVALCSISAFLDLKVTPPPPGPLPKASYAASPPTKTAATLGCC